MGPYTPTGLPTNINVGKLGHESTTLDVAYKQRSASPAVVGPDGIYEYMRQIWLPNILEHKLVQQWYYIPGIKSFYLTIMYMQ